MKYNNFFKPYTTHHSLKTAIALITAALLTLSFNTWGADFTPQEIIDGATKSNISVSSAIATEASSQKVCNTNTETVSINGSANGNGDAKYIQIQADAGYTISSLSIDASINKTDGNTYKIGIVFFEDGYSTTVTDKTEMVIANKNATSGCGPYDISVPSGTRTVRIYRAIKINASNVFNGSGTQYGSGQNTYVAGISATASAGGGGGGGETYDITYHCDGATSGCPANATEQSKLPNPLPTPVKTDYFFGGWYTDAELTTSAVAGATLSADADLYAKWVVLGGDLTTHDAANCDYITTYCQDYVTYSGKEYEVYAMSSASSKNYWWAGTKSTTPSDANCLSTEGFTTEFTSNKITGEWIKGSSFTRGSSYSTETNEFAAVSSYYSIKLRETAQTLQIKVTGYDEIGIFASDNNATVSNNKHLVIKINGVEQDISSSISTSKTVRRFSLSPSIVSFIEISGCTTAADNHVFGFSLRLPSVRTAATAFTVSGTNLTPCVGAGESATISLNNSQSGVNYQLKKGGVATGAPKVGTGSALNWTGITDAGTYTISALSNCDYKAADMSGSAIVAPASAPTITTQPAAVTKVALSTSVTLTVATDEATPTYQWYSCDNTDGDSPVKLTGETSDKLTITSPATANTSAYYYCVIGNGGTCDAQSNVATVTSKTGCETVILASALVGGGSTITSSSGCTATANLESSGKLGGSKYLTITLSEGYFQDGDIVDINLSDVGDYGGEKIALVYGTTGSYSGFMTTDATIGSNEIILSDVPASLNTISIPRSYNNSVEDINQNHTLSKAGYTIKVSREICYCTKPTIGTQPAATTICNGSTATLSVGDITGGSTPYTYQWYTADGTAVSTGTGYNTASFTTAALTETTSYYCIVTTADDCTAKSNVVEVSVETAPTSVSISGQADYVAGQNIELTATPTGGSGSFNYQWKLNGTNIDGATSATLTINDITKSNAGQYTCTVSTPTAGCALTSSNYAVKVYTLRVIEPSSSTYTDYDFTVKAGETKIATVDVDLNENWTYQYIITDGLDHWFGNSGTMDDSNCTGWSMDNSSNVQIKTVSSGDYTFTLDYQFTGSYLVVSVAYPNLNQDADKVIYLDNSVLNWANAYYRIGNSAHSQAKAMTKVTGTDNLYKVSTDTYNAFLAWQLANNQSTTNGSVSIYTVNGSDGAITQGTVNIKKAVGDAISITPTTILNTENGCTYYNVNQEAGMKTHKATINPYSNGTVSVAYTVTEGTPPASPLTSGNVDLATTAILTITATPTAGYSLGSLTVNGTPFTSGNTHVLATDAIVEATFTINQYDVAFNLQGHGSAISEQNLDYNSLVTRPKAPDVATDDWIFGGWYKEPACTNAWNFATDHVPASDITLYAKWTADPCTSRQTLSKVIVNGKTSGNVSGHNNKEYAGTPVINVSGTNTAEVDATNAGTETGYKLNSNDASIVFATLKKGTFQANDIVKITITKINDNFKVDGDAQILDIYYGTSKDDATLLTTLTHVSEPGTYKYRLTDDDVTAIGSKTGIGVFRSSTRAQNQYIYSVEITGCREWTPVPTVSVSGYDGSAVCDGTEITLTASTTGDVTNYQWYLDDKKIDGETSSTLDIELTSLNNGKKITVEVSNSVHTVKSDPITIKLKPGAISGPTEVMRTKEIVLTANKNGGTWSIIGSDATISDPDETDGKTSKVTLTGEHEGSVTVKYTLDGVCFNTYNVDITPYVICADITANNLKSPFTLTNEGTDLQVIRPTNSDAAPDLAGTTTFTQDIVAGAPDEIKAAYPYSTINNQRIVLKPSVSVTEIIVYSYNTSERTIKSIGISSTGAGESYTKYTKGTDLNWTFERNTTTNIYTLTISAVGDYYFPADKYLWIEYSGSGFYTYDICYQPVDCSTLTVTPSGSTTLDYDATVTLTPSPTGGEFTTDDDDVITLTDNKDGTVTVRAKSVNPASTADVTYTLPNGCSVTTTINVNADPCPEPSITLYTATEQTLGINQPLILSGIGTVKTGTLTYQWYSNSIASTVGATPLTPTALSEHDYITTTAATATDTYYFLRVTNTVGGNSKSVNSDFIKITTVAACAENILIKAEVTGQNSGSVTVGEGTVSVKQSSTQHTSDGKTAWRLGSSGHYFFVSMSEGYFKNGDIVRITYVRGNGNSGGDIQLYSSNADDGQLADHVIYGTNTTVALVSKDVVFKGIPDNTINSIGVRRTSTDQQNEAIYSIEVIRPICFTDQTTCLGDVVNTQVCQLDNAAGYTYEWKVNETTVGNKYNYTATATATAQNIVCTISKDGLPQGTMQIKLTGDGTAFTPSKTTYFRGETETFIPTVAGGTWSSSNTSVATIDPATGLFTAVSETDAEVKITFTNGNGCSHSETVSVTNPYFVFNATSDNNWKTIANWTYATDESTYASIGATGILPKIENRVIVKDSCVVDIKDARAELVRLAQSPTQTGKLTILPNGALTIKSTLRAITSDGEAYGSEEKITDDKLLIESSEDGVGALAFIESDNNMLPEAKVGYYFQAYYNKSVAGSAQWQYVGVPFSDPASFHYFFYGGYIQKWIEKSNKWEQVKNGSDEASTSPKPFTGYAFTQVNEGGYYNSSTGTLNPTKDQPWTLEINKTSVYDNTHGRNLLANSWTSPIYVNATGDGVNKPFVFRKDGVESDDAIEKTFYVFNCGTYGQWEKDYKQTTVVTQGSSAAAAPGQYLAMPILSAPFLGETTIAPMQGFFVYALEEGAELTINYELAVQNLAETTKATTPRHISARNKKENNNIRLTKITVIGETGADEAYILTGDDSFTNSFDNGWDGRKFESGTDVPYIAMLTNSGKMQVSAQPELLGTTLSFRPGNDDYYELVITTEETDLMLKDMQTNTLVQLKDTTYYPFFTDSKSMSSRFCIVKKPAVITSLDRESGSELNAFVSDGEIIVSNFTGKPLDGGLYDVTGKLIQHFNATTELTPIAAPAVKGVYLIRIADQTFKITL